MTKYIKPVLISALFSLCLTDISSQVPGDIRAKITKQFQDYCKAVQREEIYMHTDRDMYIAGEELWFSVYLVYRQSNTPASDEKLTYIELLNQENHPVLQKRILMNNGFGPGQLFLPDSLSSGTYTLRAYTSWMKNFLPGNCFMKDIKIYNAFSNKPFIGKSFSGNNDVKNSRNEDITLTVNNLQPEILEIFVSANERFRSENKGVFHLLINTLGSVDMVSTEKLNSGITRVVVPKKELSPGINHITVFDSNGKPVAERFIYTPAEENSQIRVSITPGLKTREKVKVEIEPGEESGKGNSAANLSISVTQFSDKSAFPGLTDYFVFGSEFGIEPIKALKGRKIAEIPPAETDSLLSTFRSNWIDWEKIVSGKYPAQHFNRETESHFISGKLLDRNSQQSGSGNFIFMSTPGKVAVFQYAKTDSAGGFRFNVSIDEQLKDLIIQPSEAENSSRIKFESSFSELYPQSVTFVDTLNTGLPEQFSQAAVNYQVNKIYSSSFLGKASGESVLPVKPVRFYGKPDQEIKLADYIKLPVMEEVFFELIPGTFLRKKKTEYELSVADPVDNKIYESPPGILVDGVIVKDPGIIAGIDPEIVEKIDVVRFRYLVGDYLFNGIVNVITVAGDFSSVTLPAYATRLQYRVIDKVFSFNSPDYSDEIRRKSRVPDFRNTLYWNPTAVTGDDGKTIIEFWTSDIKAEYEVNIQGIASDGKLVSVIKRIKVD
jgi:hypothetical protein